MNKILTYLLFGSLLATIHWSCDIINPEEPVPAFLTINSFALTTNPAQGSNTSNIKNGWLFVNGEFLGMYELPAEVPIIAAGPTTIRVEAGIEDNGLSTTPEIYPFYEAYERELDLVPGESTVINPTTSYLADTEFAFIEDFENGISEHFTEAITGGATIAAQQNTVRTGNFSGQFSLMEFSRPIAEIATLEKFSESLVQDGIFVYLEIDYLAEAPVFWGVAGERDAITGLERFIEPGFAPRPQWNKIYLNISRAIFDSELEEYNIIMQALLRDEDPDSANIYLDNIKLVHF